MYFALCTKFKGKTLRQMVEPDTTLKTITAVTMNERLSKLTASKWFGRHTFIHDLRDAGVQDSLIKRMMGHEDTSVTFGIYGSRTPIRAVAEALRHIN